LINGSTTTRSLAVVTNVMNGGLGLS